MGTVGQVVDMRARIFRLQINALYRQSWGLLKQYDDDMKYLRDQDLQDFARGHPRRDHLHPAQWLER